MSRNIVLLVLVTYPLLYLLPLNLVRFRWGIKNGLAAMPSEIESRAEAADRAVLFVIPLMLFALVAVSIYDSSISVYEVGLTADNWKSALGMGVMFSLLPLGLSEMIWTNAAPGVARKEPESRGPAAIWCGITVFGSFSVEFWRAFCIVALTRLGLSAWIAVAITTLFFATVSLQVSIARALGAATFGGAAGFLFVHTGSLVAPLAMAIVSGLTSLYQIRRACSVFRPPVSRDSQPCPVCNEVMRYSEVRRAGDMITCPHCGESLTLEKNSLWVIFGMSFVIAAYLTKHLVYEDLLSFFFTIGLTFVFGFVGVFLQALFIPLKYKRVQGAAFDKELSLFGNDESDLDKKKTQK